MLFFNLDLGLLCQGYNKVMWDQGSEGWDLRLQPWDQDHRPWDRDQQFF